MASTANEIRVEFFGVARRCAGVAEVRTSFAINRPVTLRDILVRVADLAPEFGKHCVSVEGDLRADLLACVDGRYFVTDVSQTIQAGCAVLIMSADPGG